MSDSADPTWPGSQEVEALVGRAVAERIDPLRAQLATVGRALSILAEQMSAPQQAGPPGDAPRGIDADAVLERITALETLLQRESEERRSQTDELRQALAVAVAHAVAKLEQARTADAPTAERIEAARATDARRLLEQIAALAEALASDVDGRAAKADELRASLAEALTAAITELSATIDQTLVRIEAARAADARRFTEQASALVAQAEVEARRREEQASALLAAVDDRLQSLHRAGVTRIEAMAEGHNDEARAVEKRLGALFVEMAERAEAAVDHGRARIAEGQVALGTRLDVRMGELLSMLSGAAAGLEARVTESARSLQGSTGEQSAALLEAIDRSRQQLGEGLADVKATLLAAETASAARADDAASLGRLDELDRSLADALTNLDRAIAACRDELLDITTRALERSTAVNDAATTSGMALEDLRASQAVLRELVQEGAHKAELAALEIRGLRDRLTPHLVALAEATTRRSEADQAGFDAVLARLDQLLADRQP